MRKIWVLLVLLISFVQYGFSSKKESVFEYFGKITCAGKGIPAVAITDGYTVTVSDIKGNYKLNSTVKAEFIYLSVPAPYQMPLQNGRPYFYRALENKEKHHQEINFELEQLSHTEDQHKLIVCADPQVAFVEELKHLEIATNDIARYRHSALIDFPVYGIVCGDIISDIQHSEPSFETVAHYFTATQIPFFYLPGNHDLDINLRSNANSKSSYQHVFGPRYYSFNRGKIHYVVLDDVFATGRNNEYIGYLTEDQLNWLAQDLALLPKNSTVILSLHIPTFSKEARKGQYGKEDIKKVLQNRKALYQLLEPFRVHILSGHEHYQENYLISNNITEHVNSALCGLFWQAPYNSDGTPAGYTIFTIDGEHISWEFKPVGSLNPEQFAVYPIHFDKSNPQDIVVNVWNYASNWKVYWYEDGIKMGEMCPYTGYDPLLVKYVEEHQAHFRYKYIGAGPTEHLFQTKPLNQQAKITVEVIDPFGKSTKKSLE